MYVPFVCCQDQPDPLNKIRMKVRKNMADLVKNQKLSYMRDGCMFKTYGQQQKQKDKKGGPLYMYVRLHDNGQVLMWGHTANPTEKLQDLPNTGKIPQFCAKTLVSISPLCVTVSVSSCLLVLLRSCLLPY